ncbi:hypothetical protein HispidOSU_023252, partial [Sigmodon hispidus]
MPVRRPVAQTWAPQGTLPARRWPHGRQDPQSGREKCQLWDSECRSHHLCRDWGDVRILHKRLPRAQSWSCSSAGDESSVHRFRIHAAHLG